MTYVSRRLVRLVAVLCAGSSLAACATVTRGSEDAWVVNSEPSGAKVETTNGHQCQATPCAIKMKRKSEFTATLTKPGYKPATVQVSHKTAGAGAAGVAGNVLVGGVIGIGVDMYTGASQDLVPNPVTVKLEPEAPAPAKIIE
ncbi:MAG: PEGA domain-containing protein [Pseudomonadota bacterium]|uniref:PEGA domain-containing protein n=1 Tax=Phenylobacterium sp. TaxID=1871053 RepID=UPI0025FFB1B7|nr:PEGA domain-containing protein [Phenylobacterium sp.]MBT9473745.1 PEGA domain-containing protein [Phenylobacterium sp.]